MALRINDTTSILRLLNNLNRTETDRNITLARLSTGKRINTASDDPAGLIALRSLETEIAAIDAAIDNNQRTKSMLEVAEGALTEVNSLLTDIQGLAVAAAGDTLSASEKAANQAQIDSALASIDRIINSASFNGKKLFGGANQIAATMTAADAADIKDVRIYSRNPSQTGTVSLTVNVAAAATRGTTSGTSIATITENLSAATTVTIAGELGTATITIASGSSLAQMVTTINDSKGLTGVSAKASGNDLRLDATDYGSDSFVSITALSGDVDVVSKANTGKLAGTDATVTINGQTALTSGTEIYYNGNGISLSATLASNTTGTRTINVTGGGATFQLGTDSSGRANIGLNTMSSYSLGRSDLGYLSDLKSGGSASLANDPAAAVSIVKKVITQVATSAGRIGGFVKYQVQPTINSLSVTKENTSAAASIIGDADLAMETAKLDRQNILAQAAVSLFAVINNQQNSLLSLFI